MPSLRNEWVSAKVHRLDSDCLHSVTVCELCQMLKRRRQRQQRPRKRRRRSVRRSHDSHDDLKRRR